MPTYEYRCAKGHAFDVFQRMSDAPVATCPDCGAQAERVLSGGAGFLFKGEGFYITDYRSEEYRKKAEAEKGSAPKVEERKPLDASAGKRKDEKADRSGESAPKADRSGESAPKADRGKDSDKGAAGSGASSAGDTRKGRGGAPSSGADG